ncbi:MAG: hypothetical protein IIT97_03820, partial [Mycoplasmataceae bacterium]|nr:hypothetical protein [Mycoplasmataceae bacterium]
VVKQFIESHYGKKEASHRIVAITDAKKGALKTLATQEGYKTLIYNIKFKKIIKKFFLKSFYYAIKILL